MNVPIAFVNEAEDMKFKLRNQEISWLSFNERLLQEAADPSVPLIERIKFLGIFSANLDEFFRVRVATLKRLEKLGKKAVKLIGHDPHEVLEQIQRIVLTQQKKFDGIYRGILSELEKENIFIIREDELNERQAAYVRLYFHREVRPALIPLMVDQLETFPELKDHAIYLAVRMWQSKNPKKYKYALIEVPTEVLPRFCILPREDQRQTIILLDDVIRFNLGQIFSMFNFDRFEAYTIKLTRDAELDLGDDLSEGLLNKILKALSRRKTGTPVRFIFDQEIPPAFLKFLIRKIHSNKIESNFIPGSRYHNFKDFVHFPNIGPARLRYPALPPLPHEAVEGRRSLLQILDRQDILIHYPYQTFDYVIDFLREAAIDPHVTSIQITVYRLANQSKVVNALVNAVRNGKSVTVAMELKARFDEEANIQWAQRLREEGVRVVYSSQEFKVHAKLILVTRKAKRKTQRYACIGTGNFNEATARLYADHSLFTADQRLTREVHKVLEALESDYTRAAFRHLLVAPLNMRQKWTKLIDCEIKNAAKGKDAYILAKLNNLTDPQIIKKLYQASQAGVKIRLMVRGMFSLIPGVKGMSKNIRATGTIDRFLEHSRIFVFCHGNNEKYFISSADWMPRNLDKRVEVACPIYDKKCQQELRDYLEIHWRDNVKARILNSELDNPYRRGEEGEGPVRAQTALYAYFREKVHPEPVQMDRASAKMTTPEIAGQKVGIPEQNGNLPPKTSPAASAKESGSATVQPAKSAEKARKE